MTYSVHERKDVALCDHDVRRSTRDGEGWKRKAPKVAAKARILRSSHVHRSRAHTSSVTRRRQARRDK